ncbi:TetR/AcrR family transcriptional regulator [Pengzhenrongella phosphoraccumulans]|uniref:TetR/AcrR family transcriptional regulator n=1 Tax=Pengzhenrongella phosphoraccumulans TaxID=3114394 RepID=UPI00388DE097
MERLPIVERRAQLVRAALAVASRDGIEAATVRAIAAEAGVSLGVVHYCFEDKNELLREVGEAIAAQGVDRVELARLARPDAQRAIGAAITTRWEAMRAHRGVQLLSFELTTQGLRNPELCGVATAQRERNLRAAHEMLDEAAAVANIRWTVPIQLLARFSVAAMDGVVLAWLVDDDDEAARAALSSLTTHLTTHTTRK